MHTITEQMAGLKAEVDTLVARADGQGRDLTPAELARVNECGDEHARLRAHAEKAEKARLLVKSLAGDAPWPAPGAARTKSRRAGVPGSPWAKAVTERLATASAGLGAKSLFQGSVTTPPVWSVDDAGYAEVVDQPTDAPQLLNLVSGFEFGDGPYSYLRQVVRDDRADVVPDGQTKPTSVYTLQEHTERPRVIAHLSEEMPLRYLDDHDRVIALLDAQMRAGVVAKLEQQLLSGTGEGEQFTGLLNTTGINAVAFGIDALTTIRRARTRLAALSEVPTAAVMHPDDYEQMDLLRDTTGRYRFDAAAVSTVFGDVARVVSPLMPKGKVLLGNFRLAAIGVKQGTHTLAATQAGDMFQRNAFLLRAEGRFGIAVHRPRAFAVATITPGDEPGA